MAAPQDHNSDRTTRGYVLTALTKLAGRLGEEQEDAIEALLQTYSGSMNLELQVRANSEASAILVAVFVVVVVFCCYSCCYCC